MSSGAWMCLEFLWLFKSDLAIFTWKPHSKTLLEKQCENFSHCTALSFRMNWCESHTLSMTDIQHNLLEYVILHASFCGNLFILITGFLKLRCDCPQEESKLVTPPFSLANVPNTLLKCIFRRGDSLKYRKHLKPKFLAFDHVIKGPLWSHW